MIDVFAVNPDSHVIQFAQVKRIKKGRFARATVQLPEDGIYYVHWGLYVWKDGEGWTNE